MTAPNLFALQFTAACFLGLAVLFIGLALAMLVSRRMEKPRRDEPSIEQVLWRKQADIEVAAKRLRECAKRGRDYSRHPNYDPVLGLYPQFPKDDRDKQSNDRESGPLNRW